jgi:hypothetical protein
LHPKIALVANLTLSDFGAFDANHDSGVAMVVGPAALIRVAEPLELKAGLGYALIGYEIHAMPDYFHHASGIGGMVSVRWLPFVRAHQTLGVSAQIAPAVMSNQSFATYFLALDWQYE